jgi:hypothetical protein
MHNYASGPIKAGNIIFFSIILEASSLEILLTWDKLFF